MSSNLITSLLKANKKHALALKKQLLACKTKKGNAIFTCKDIEHGFEITGKKKIDGMLTEIVVFRFTENPGPKIEYDKDLITVD